MDELIDLMVELLAEIRDMNSKLDDIRGSGLNSIDDMCEKMDDIKVELESIKGTGLYDSIADVCNKLDEIKGNGLYDSIADVCQKLDGLETTITLGDNY